MQVLLVDDNSLTIKIGRRMLERMGWQVVVAMNGRQAVEACRRGGIDLVLMDGNMPVMTGPDAIAAIRELPGEAGRVSILCTSSCEMMAQRCFEAGANGFLDKPFEPEALRNALSLAMIGLIPLLACATAALPARC